MRLQHMHMHGRLGSVNLPRVHQAPPRPLAHRQREHGQYKAVDEHDVRHEARAVAVVVAPALRLQHVQSAAAP